MNVDRSTIIRTVMFAIALINYALQKFGINPIPESADLATAIVTIAIFVWSWWKNNSFTEDAIIADQFMIGLKNGLIVEDEEAGE